MGGSLIKLLLGGTAAFLLMFSGLVLEHLMLNSDIFAMEEVTVSGASRVEPREIVQLSGLTPGINIFSADLEAVASRVGTHPWVEEVRVRRSLPRGVDINITEWRPVASILQEGKQRYIDPRGLVFTGWGRVDGLPRVSCARGGENILGTAVEALTVMGGAAREVVVDGVDGVTMVGYDGNTVHVGMANMESKRERLVRIQDALRARRLRAEFIDMDFPDRAFVRVAGH